MKNIFVKKTISEEGYHPKDLCLYSRKYIWAKCRICKKFKRTRMKYYTQSG